MGNLITKFFNCMALAKPDRKIIRYSVVDEQMHILANKGIFLLLGEIDDNTCATMLVRGLTQIPESKEMWVLINSPGGGVYSGFGIYDALKMLIANGVRVNTIGVGVVASMASVILQAGIKRYSLPNTHFLVHQVSSATEGEVNQQRDQLNQSMKLNVRAMNIIANRCGKPVKEVMDSCQKKDVWMTPEKAKLYGPNGLIDEIIQTLPFPIV